MVKESSVQVEEKYPELSKLIQTGKERGFIMYEELYENLPEEVTGVAEELDDIYMRLSELDIDIMDAESAEEATKASSKRAKAGAESGKNGKKPAAKKNDTKPVATEQLELARERYRLGAAAFLELLEAQTSMATAERDYLNALYTFHGAMWRLEEATGLKLRPESTGN